MPDADPYALLACALYLVLMLGIGLLASRKASAGIDEFFLAGRGLSRLVVALSAVASGRSAWLLLGFSSVAYLRGVSAIWMAVGYTLVEFALFFTLAPRMRRLSGEHGCVTVPDLFAARFGEQRALRVLIALVFLAFMTPYVGAQFVAGGKTFHSAFGLEPLLGELLTAGIVLGYTVTGGFLAVSLTDAVQASVMLAALVGLPLLALSGEGGWSAVARELASLDPTLVDPTALAFGALVGWLGIGLGSPGNPHIAVRYMSIRSESALGAAGWIALATNVLMALGALGIGLLGRAHFPQVAELPGGDPETVYPALAGAVLHPFLFGIAIAAIFAAIMSTADSQLLVAASSIVRDLYERGGGSARSLEPRTLVLASRLAIAGLVVCAWGVARLGGGVVNALVLYAWGGLGAALGPPLLLAFYWSRTTAAGALAGVFVGAGSLIAWELWGDDGLYELIPAFAAGTLAVVLVSLLGRRDARA